MSCEPNFEHIFGEKGTRMLRKQFIEAGNAPNFFTFAAMNGNANHSRLGRHVRAMASIVDGSFEVQEAGGRLRTDLKSTAFIKGAAPAVLLVREFTTPTFQTDMLARSQEEFANMTPLDIARCPDNETRQAKLAEAAEALRRYAISGWLSEEARGHYGQMNDWVRDAFRDDVFAEQARYGFGFVLELATDTYVHAAEEQQKSAIDAQVQAVMGSDAQFDAELARLLGEQ